MMMMMMMVVVIDSCVCACVSACACGGLCRCWLKWNLGLWLFRKCAHVKGTSIGATPSPSVNSIGQWKPKHQPYLWWKTHSCLDQKSHEGKTLARNHKLSIAEYKKGVLVKVMMQFCQYNTLFTSKVSAAWSSTWPHLLQSVGLSLSRHPPWPYWKQLGVKKATEKRQGDLEVGAWFVYVTYCFTA